VKAKVTKPEPELATEEDPARGLLLAVRLTVPVCTAVGLEKGSWMDAAV